MKIQVSYTNNPDALFLTQFPLDVILRRGADIFRIRDCEIDCKNKVVDIKITPSEENIFSKKPFRVYGCKVPYIEMMTNIELEGILLGFQLFPENQTKVMKMLWDIFETPWYIPALKITDDITETSVDKLKESKDLKIPPLYSLKIETTHDPNSKLQLGIYPLSIEGKTINRDTMLRHHMTIQDPCSYQQQFLLLLKKIKEAGLWNEELTEIDFQKHLALYEK